MEAADLQKIRRQNVVNILAKLKAGKTLTAKDEHALADFEAENAEALKTAEKPPAASNDGMTAKQIAFADLVVGGTNMAQAYRKAYAKPAAYKDTEASNQGYRIARIPRVATYIAALRARSQGHALLSLNDRLALLAGDARHPARSAADRNARARTLEVYSKIAGDQPPERHEISGPQGAPIQQQQVTGVPVRQRLAALTAALEAGR